MRTCPFYRRGIQGSRWLSPLSEIMQLLSREVGAQIILTSKPTHFHLECCCSKCGPYPSSIPFSETSLVTQGPRITLNPGHQNWHLNKISRWCLFTLKFKALLCTTQASPFLDLVDGILIAIVNGAWTEQVSWNISFTLCVENCSTLVPYLMYRVYNLWRPGQNLYTWGLWYRVWPAVGTCSICHSSFYSSRKEVGDMEWWHGEGNVGSKSHNGEKALLSVCSAGGLALQRCGAEVEGLFIIVCVSG